MLLIVSGDFLLERAEVTKKKTVICLHHSGYFLPSSVLQQNSRNDILYLIFKQFVENSKYTQMGSFTNDVKHLPFLRLFPAHVRSKCVTLFVGDLGLINWTNGKREGDYKFICIIVEHTKSQINFVRSAYGRNLNCKLRKIREGGKQDEWMVGPFCIFHWGKGREHNEQMKEK